MSRALWKEAHRLARLGTVPRNPYRNGDKLMENITMARLSRRPTTVLERSVEAAKALKSASEARLGGMKQHAWDAVYWAKDLREGRDPADRVLGAAP